MSMYRECVVEMISTQSLSFKALVGGPVWGRLRRCGLAGGTMALGAGFENLKICAI